MPETIPVRVSGPALLRRAVCCLLGTFPDIIASEDTAAPVEPTVVRLIITACASDPCTLLPDAPYRVALLTAGTEAELNAACTTGIRVLLSMDDDPRTLHQGITATERAEPFCSPILAPHLMNALHTRTASELRRREGDQVRAKLSSREHEVAQLAASGLSNQEIASLLCISLCTVKAHLNEVYKKLGVHRRGKIMQIMGGVKLN